MDGSGAGLVVHEKALGKVFHVQCLHIPACDRTTLEGLIEFVEETVMIEHILSPNKPIYLLGESFGGSLALAVAARNPTIDLILVIANPATSYERSPLHPLVAFMRTLPDECYRTFPYVTSFLLGDFIKTAMVKNDGTNYSPSLLQFLSNIIEDLPLFSALTKIVPRDTLKWRIDLVQSAAAYANSRLHSVKAQVLVLASGKDNLLPSKNEAQRLSGILKHCQIRVFEENGHTILMESGVNVLSAIKTTRLYRRALKHDVINDFLPPSIREFKTTPMDNWWYRLSMGAAMFSTMEDGKIVRGLGGIPDEGPVLLVGNHLLWGFETIPFVLQFLREKKVVLHALTHPETFSFNVEDEYLMIPYTDILKQFGAIPVSARNLFKLLSRKSYTLLYPGGARESFHRKGEACKLFWPDKQEFVRMAVKFGATIIPFGVVGEDDISELLIDYDEMKRNPFLNRWVNDFNQGKTNVRKNIGIASYDDGGKKSGKNVPEELEPLWDDGYGTQTVKDYAEISMDLIKSDGGPPRWFCPVACGVPLKDAPVLLYLPGIDGTGAGLVVHEKALGKVFHVQCFHIPVLDRTPFKGLIKIVEETVITEHTSSPNKPIYLLGESFGGALALVVAARNPTIDVILVLANPATSYERSPVHPLISTMGALPMSPLLGDFVKMATVEINGTGHWPSLWQVFGNLAENIPLLSVLDKILPKDTLNWRLKLVESAAAYANSRLHAITAQVLVLASGKDNLLPSKNEAHRLTRLLKRCYVRVFEENGHAILLENGVNVLSAIKTTQLYRRSSKHDIIKDYLPTSITQFKNIPFENWWYRLYTGTAVFSTMEDGKIVRGLAGIPDEGPVLVVGNHMLFGFDAFFVVLEFLREKKITLHGLAHPELYQIRAREEFYMVPYTDVVKLLGAIPVSGRNLFKLLSRKSYALLYPGGARESLHRKGESCKLFWPDKQEFVRMAVKLGATIIPFGAVGEDDLSELLVDYNDMKRIPFLKQMWDEYNRGRKNVREGMGGEISKQQLHLPIFLPKLPGRLYFMFGKPIRTKGKEKMLDDRDYLRELYLQIRCDVENNMAYLLKKREEDPYRSIVDRFMWQRNYGSLDHIPSFEP